MKDFQELRVNDELCGEPISRALTLIFRVRDVIFLSGTVLAIS